jgi:hypothetical protein
MNKVLTKELISKKSLLKNLPFPLFAKERGAFPPFGKGRSGGIL